jgi:hypothetical protein
MKKLYLTLLLLSSFCLTNAQIQLSKYAEVSVLTIGPGTALNDAFGHNAIRIKDPMYKLDLVFDYGRYNFEAEGFYVNFARGKLIYEIGWSEFSDFIEHYKNAKREVKSQTLNLTATEKQTLFTELQRNIQPQNKSYTYDFFYNNCATKIKDVFISVCSKKIVFNEPKDFEPLTFRELIRSAVPSNTWGGFGIDLALGSVIDQTATSEEHMFLPNYIYAFFKIATFEKAQKKLVKKETILNAEQVGVQTFFWSSPLFVFGVLGLLLILITYKDYSYSSRTQWVDVTIFTLTGLIGTIVILLWFATDHTATAYNYNSLWAFAFNLLLIPTVFKKRVKKRFIGYLKFLILLLLLMLLHWCTNVQSFNIAVIPIWITLMIRYLYLCKWSSGNLNTP